MSSSSKQFVLLKYRIIHSTNFEDFVIYFHYIALHFLCLSTIMLQIYYFQKQKIFSNIIHVFIIRNLDLSHCNKPQLPVFNTRLLFYGEQTDTRYLFFICFSVYIIDTLFKPISQKNFDVTTVFVKIEISFDRDRLNTFSFSLFSSFLQSQE